MAHKVLHILFSAWNRCYATHWLVVTLLQHLDVKLHDEILSPHISFLSRVISDLPLRILFDLLLFSPTPHFCGTQHNSVVIYNFATQFKLLTQLLSHNFYTHRKCAVRHLPNTSPYPGEMSTPLPVCIIWWPYLVSRKIVIHDVIALMLTKRICCPCVVKKNTTP